MVSAKLVSSILYSSSIGYEVSWNPIAAILPALLHSRYSTLGHLQLKLLPATKTKLRIFILEHFNFKDETFQL